MQYVVLLLLLAVMGGINFYLAHHVWRWIHYFFPNFSIVIPLIFFLTMAVMMLLSFFKPFGGSLQRVISTIGGCWMGIFVYLLIFCLLADLALLVPWLFRLLSGCDLAKLRAVAGVSAAVLTFTVSLYGFCHARQLYTAEYDVRLSPAPLSEMKLVFISDVHLGAMGSERRLERIVEEVNGLEPDLVCIAGDFFDTNFLSIKDPEKAIQTMQKIRSRYGVYACTGNHDSGKTFASMQDFFVRANVTLLMDEYAVIDDRLILAGRLDSSPIGGAGGLQRDALTAVLEGADPSLPVIVLDHNPGNVDTYEKDVELVLSGHTHKGQIFPGPLITKAMYTVDYGYARTESGMQVIVSSGAGIWGPPMRVGSNCEIVSIKLKI